MLSVMRCFLVLAACALALPAHAAADDVPVNLTVRGGELALRVISARAGRAVVEVVDARGSGAGWMLTMAGGATVRRVSARCAARSTCTLPSSTLAYPLTTPTARQTRVFGAAAGTGMGAIVLRVSYDGGRPRFAVR
jgi:hypothetical protein